MTSRHRYTVQEFQALRREAEAAFAAGESADSIVKRFRVGRSTAERWRTAWLAQSPKAPPTFTAQEDERLRAMYATYTREEIAEALGKKVNAVRHRAFVLGLRKRNVQDRQVQHRASPIEHPAPGVTIHRCL